MSDNPSDQNKGFSGLSSLTSQSDTNRENTRNAEIFDLIELSKWPSIPAPWSSDDEGESWVWGDFFMILQKNPETMAQTAYRMQGKEPPGSGMKYHYAMNVFYRLDRNPHGPSKRPVLVVGLEQANLGMVADVIGLTKDIFDTDENDMGSLMLGLFNSKSRYNLGAYNDDYNLGTIKKHFFKIIGNNLNLKGTPEYIGKMFEAYGHPKTGLPSKTKSGCLSILVLCFLGFLLIYRNL